MPVRVLIATLPVMLHDIVCDAFSQQPTLQIVGKVGPEDDVAAAARRYKADVVVMGAQPEQDTTAERILFARPRMRVLTVGADGRAAQLYRLLPQCMIIDDVSPTQLVAAILQSTGSA